MRRCIDKPKDFAVSVLLLVFSFVVLFYASPRILQQTTQNIRSCLVAVFCFSVLLVNLLCAVLLFLFSVRKYRVDKDGLEIQYLIFPPILYPWDQISEIGICKVHYNSRGMLKYDTVIRCVIGKEKRGPRHGYGAWATIEYEMFHLTKVIPITLSALRLNEFERIAQAEIVDYRKIKLFPYEAD